MRKHRRLIEVKASPTNLHMTSSPDALLKFMPTGAPGAISGDNEYVIGLIWNGLFNYKIKISPDIVLHEARRPGRRPAIADLSEFASLANSIIKLFDTP